MSARKATSKRSRRDPNTPPRVVILTRLSKSGSDEVPHETQENGCRRKVEALGGVVVAVLHDTVSGDRLDRRGLRQAIEHVQAGDADVLMTYRVDRLGRDQVQQGVIIYELRRAGGDYVSATEDLAAGPLGDFLRSVYAFAGEMELVKIRDRVNDALDARFAQKQRYKPAKRPPYGYAKVGTGEAASYVEDPAEAAIVRRIFAQAAAGVSRRMIAKRLNDDQVPTPTGKGKWGTTVVVTILTRAAYWTGQHEVWRTSTARDEDGVPYREERPQDERYFVSFPVLIEPVLAERARAGAARNRWSSARHDRSPACGLLRYGGAFCSGCGRSLSLIAPKVGGERYACTHRMHDRRRCDASVSITRDQLDPAIVEWVTAVVLDPLKAASRWVEVEERPEVDSNLLARLAAAEKAVSDFTGRVTTLAANLALVTGPAATVAANQLNALSEELAATTAERDAIADEAARLAFPVHRAMRRVSPETVVAQAVDAALQAGWEAHRAWLEQEWGRLQEQGGALAFLPSAPDITAEPMYALQGWVETDHMVLPPHDSVPGWHAWQAMLATLGVTVTVNQAGGDAPRWVARMQLPGGEVEGTCTYQPRCSG